jgi:hypothetical protein
MEGFLSILLILGSVMLVLGLASSVLVWLAVRRIRRSGIVRRAADNGVLTLHSLAMDRTVREPARLALELRRSNQANRRALNEAVQRGWPVGNLPDAADELERAAAALGDQLRIADREPNRALKRELSADLTHRVRALEGMSVDLRRCLLRSSVSVDRMELERSGARLEMEISAMHSWLGSYGIRRAS